MKNNYSPSPIISKNNENENDKNKKNKNTFKERFQSIVSRDTVFGKKNNEVADNQDKKIVMDEKISSINKKIARIIKKHGYILNIEDSLSEKMLDDKGITKLMNVKDLKIKNRIHHGFLYKKHKAHDYFQKRWLFIFSSRISLNCCSDNPLSISLHIFLKVSKVIVLLSGSSINKLKIVLNPSLLSLSVILALA